MSHRHRRPVYCHLCRDMRRPDDHHTHRQSGDKEPATDRADEPDASSEDRT